MWEGACLHQGVVAEVGCRAGREALGSAMFVNVVASAVSGEKSSRDIDLA